MFYSISNIDIDENVKENISYTSKNLLNIINNTMKIKGNYVEFKLINQSTNKVFENDKKPLLSLIYSKEGLFTDFTFEEYKYRNINENTKMYYFENSCVCYDLCKLFINLNKSYFIEIHVWNEIFDYPEHNMNIIVKEINPRIIYIDFIDYEWFNSLIYKKINVIDKIKKELTNSENYSIEQNDNEIYNGYLIVFDKCPLLQRKKNYELQIYNINDLIQMITKNIIHTKYSHKIISNYLQYDLCRWIHDETLKEKNIEKTVFFNFMKFFLETLGNNFTKMYLFDVRLKINYIGIEITSKCIKKGTFIAIIPLMKSKINNIKMNEGDLYLCPSLDIPILNENNNYIAIYIDFVL